jgi:hypothetical protein
MVIVPARQATQAGGIHPLQSIHGLHKRLKILALSAVVASGRATNLATHPPKDICSVYLLLDFHPTTS